MAVDKVSLEQRLAVACESTYTQTAMKKDIRKLTPEVLNAWALEAGVPAYRARQIYAWLWQKGALEFAEMTDLPLALRQQLADAFEIKPIQISAQQISRDGTIKTAFRLHDGNQIEGVMIPSGGRNTACVSSQVGCSLNCKFCATGYLDRQRNLDAAEIVDQVRMLDQLAREHTGKGLSNIVYMGMGEPLLNYQEVMRSVELLTSPSGLGMSPQRITVSTAGIAKMIKRLADDNTGVQLALSLHAANDVARTEIMPINESNGLDLLAEAMSYFYDKTGNRPTLEYTVMEGVNDSVKEMEELAAFARRFPAKINLIEYNPISMADFRPSSHSGLQDFAQGLERKRLIVNVRRSRGKDIDAACGQLANKLDN
jgi:23S rRNA (adenine2503-C2)-methyltransferase